MLQLIRGPVLEPNSSLPAVLIRVDRQRLAKRLWRAVAEDGVEFGFELETPLKPDQTVFEANKKRYVIAQEPEHLLEISLDMPASAAAGIGWAIGNMHLELSADATRLHTPDEPSTRQLLERLSVPFRPVSAVFRPGRFTRGGAAAKETQDLGPGHRH